MEMMDVKQNLRKKYCCNKKYLDKVKAKQKSFLDAMFL